LGPIGLIAVPIAAVGRLAVRPLAFIVDPALRAAFGISLLSLNNFHNEFFPIFNLHFGNE
jgi:hypothetical protein